MITLIHGEDVASSRNYLTEIKSKKKNFHSFTGDSITREDVLQVVSGGSLFEEIKTIVIEDFFPKKKTSGDTKDIFDVINKHGDSLDVYIWENKEISKSVYGKINNLSVKNFSYPKVLFQFLDSLKPGNKEMVRLFHESIENAEVEMVFFMMQRQFRLLLTISELNSIEEVKKLAPWQAKNLTKQANFFSQGTLISLYSRLFEIDKKSKTGQLSLTLTQAIDFFLVDLYHNNYAD